MTDLQIGLAIIGGVAVVAVLIYNRWQERGAKREAQRAFASGHTDVLLDGRREPIIEPRHASAPPAALPAEKVDYVIALDLPSARSRAVVHEGWAPIERRFARRAF